MKKKILFLAPFPTKENIKDGMISRVHAIDSLFIDKERIYLEISLFRHTRKIFYRDNKALIYRLNAFIHCLLIAKVFFSCKSVYSHSIWGCIGVWHLLLFYHGKLILDAHGVVPEEIQLYSKIKWAVPMLNIIERIVFYKSTVVICVTNYMKEYYKSKYPSYKGQYLVYSIYPESLKSINIDKLRKKHIETNTTVLYSGGISPWQNINLMLDTIKRNNRSNFNYILAVTNVAVIEKLLIEKEINCSNIKIISVLPSELPYYYAQADYAFILRDDNIVNRVANPTKIVEYLSFGIVPIVLSPKIGDYFELGYEYIYVEDFERGVLNHNPPSRKNMKIVQDSMNKNNEISIVDFIT